VCWPHPVVVGITTNLVVGGEVFSCKSVSRILHFVGSEPIHFGAVSLYKFCVFVSGRHCPYFEGKFRSLLVLFLLYRINHRMQATIKYVFEVRNSCTLVVSVSFLILSSLFSAVPEVFRHYRSSWSHVNQRGLYSTKSVPPVHFALR